MAQIGEKQWGLQFPPPRLFYRFLVLSGLSHNQIESQLTMITLSYQKSECINQTVDGKRFVHHTTHNVWYKYIISSSKPPDEE